MGSSGATSGYQALFCFEPQWRARHDFQSRLRLEDGALEELIVVCNELDQELSQKKNGFQVEALALLSRILVRLSRAYAGMSVPLSQTLVRLEPVLQWVEQHYAEPVTLEQLADRAHMSPRTLTRCFNESFGMSPMNYVIDVRLRRAEEMLSGSDARVKDVAPKVGIDDASYFARLFRKRTGLEPSAFRAQQRERSLVKD